MTQTRRIEVRQCSLFHGFNTSIKKIIDLNLKEITFEFKELRSPLQPVIPRGLAPQICDTLYGLTRPPLATLVDLSRLASTPLPVLSILQAIHSTV